MQTYVIVGGSHDGERIEQEAVRPRLSLCEKRRDKLSAGINEGRHFKEGYKMEHYTPHDWCVDNGRAIKTLYALAGMSDMEVMEMLLDGYRKPAAKR